MRRAEFRVNGLAVPRGFGEAWRMRTKITEFVLLAISVAVCGYLAYGL